MFAASVQSHVLSVHGVHTRTAGPPSPLKYGALNDGQLIPPAPIG